MSRSVTRSVLNAREHARHTQRPKRTALNAAEDGENAYLGG